LESEVPIPTFIVNPSSSSSSAIVESLVFSSSLTASFLLPRFLDFELLRGLHRISDYQAFASTVQEYGI
jgi:hypothetical protein